MRREKWTLKSPVSGEIIGAFVVEAEPVRDEIPATTPPAQTSQAQRPPLQGGANGPTGETMTEPQKRYIFRLLGAQGLEPKKIEAHLRDYFKVRSLSDIPKQDASAYIDQLVKDQKEAQGGSGA
jgi:hypothetical protein